MNDKDEVDWTDPFLVIDDLTGLDLTKILKELGL